MRTKIEVARAAAQAGGHANATFHVGDVTALPFEDNHFDVAHCHTVLMHVPDTRAVLAEVKRVLKPGGIIASREVFISSTFLEPGSKGVEQVLATFSGLLQSSGGHPEMGKQLKSKLLEAGFTNVRTSASFDHFGTPEKVALLRSFFDDWVNSPGAIEAVVQLGLASREDFDVWRKSLDDWRDHPGAFGAFAFGEAIAEKP